MSCLISRSAVTPSTRKEAIMPNDGNDIGGWY